MFQIRSGLHTIPVLFFRTVLDGLLAAKGDSGVAIEIRKIDAKNSRCGKDLWISVLHTMTLEVGYDSFELPIDSGTVLGFTHSLLSRYMSDLGVRKIMMLFVVNE